MEFKFNVSDIFTSPIVEINQNLVPSGHAGDRRSMWDAAIRVTEVVNAMGGASAAAQGLNKPITTADRLRNSDQTIYLLVDRNAKNGKGVVTGMLKTGKKSLYVFDRDGHHYQVSPPCVLDFYVHESRQRMGLGKQLFEHMLKKEKVEPLKMAVDRPSEKLLSFLDKHYRLNNPLRQMNNYVVFDGFFPETENNNMNGDASVSPNKSKQAANGLQPNFALPYGRYGAPRPPCSMGQIIHNQTPVQSNEPSGVSLNIRPQTPKHQPPRSTSVLQQQQSQSRIATDVCQSVPNVQQRNVDNFAQQNMQPGMQSNLQQQPYIQPNIQHVQPQQQNMQQIQHQDPVTAQHVQFQQPNMQQMDFQQSNMQYNQWQQPNVQHNQLQQPNIQHNQLLQPNVQHNQLLQPNVQHNQLQQPNVQHNQLQQPNVQQTVSRQNNQLEQSNIVYNQIQQGNMQQNQAEQKTNMQQQYVQQPNMAYNEIQEPTIDENALYQHNIQQIPSHHTSLQKTLAQQPNTPRQTHMPQANMQYLTNGMSPRVGEPIGQTPQYNRPYTQSIYNNQGVIPSQPNIQQQYALQQPISHQQVFQSPSSYPTIPPQNQQQFVQPPQQLLPSEHLISTQIPQQQQQQQPEMLPLQSSAPAQMQRVETQQSMPNTQQSIIAPHLTQPYSIPTLQPGPNSTTTGQSHQYIQPLNTEQPIVAKQQFATPVPSGHATPVQYQYYDSTDASMQTQYTHSFGNQRPPSAQTVSTPRTHKAAGDMTPVQPTEYYAQQQISRSGISTPREQQDMLSGVAQSQVQTPRSGLHQQEPMSQSMPPAQSGQTQAQNIPMQG